MTIDTQHPDELLAWYVNGTLTKSEQQQVESHLHSCTRCQREVELLRTLQQQVRSEDIAGPGDFVLKRLMKDIKKEKTSANSGRKWWELWMAAAAIVIISVQSIVIVSNPGTEVVVPLGHSTSDIKVRFIKGARMEDINKLLASQNTQFKAGPDEDNFYLLDVRDATATENPEKIRAVIKAISKHKNLVDYIDTE